MSILPHVLTGAALGSFLPNVPLSLAGGVGSHIILDFLPHWDPHLSRKNPAWKKTLHGFLLFLDIGLSLIVLALVFNYPTAFWGGFLGGLTDLDCFLKLGWLKKLGIKTHVEGSNWQTPTNLFFGLFNQSMVAALSLFVLYWQIGKNIPLVEEMLKRFSRFF